MVAEARYSAGSIFLQVVPSFRGFQDEVRKQAKAVNREVEQDQKRDGERAARERGDREAKEYAGRYSETLKRTLQQSSREIKPIQIRVDDREAQDTLETIRTHLASLGDRKLNVNLDSAEALADIEAMRAELERLRDNTHLDIEARTNVGSVIAQLKAMEAEVTRLAGLSPEIKVEVKEKGVGEMTARVRAQVAAALKALPELEFHADNTDAEHKLDQIRVALLALNADDIKPGVDTRAALLKIDALRVRLDELAASEPNIDIKVDSLRASLELRRIQEQVDKLDHSNAGGFISSINDGGNSFRAFSGILLGIALVLPALVPLLGAAAGAIALLGTAAIGAVAGLGVLVLAFSGIAAAVKALGNAQKNAAKDALAQEKAERTAAKGVRDAMQSLDQARKSAALSAQQAARAVSDAREQETRAVESALQRQDQAERALARTQRASQQAVEDLAAARKSAAQDQSDTDTAIKQNSLDQRSGLIDVFNATVSNTNAQNDPGATNLEKEQAAIALERAQLALEQYRAEGKRLAEEQAQQRKDGIDGSKKVQDAQQAVTDAVQAEVDARREVAQAAQDADRARVDGARAVADAEAAQARSAEQGANSIRDAQERVNDSLAAQQEALQKTSASADGLRDAMSKLGPAGQEFATFIFGLLPYFRSLRDVAQAGLLPGVQDFLDTLITTYGPQLKDFLGSIATTLGDLFRAAGEALKDPIWQAFFASLAQYAPIFTTLFAQVGGLLLQIIAQLATALAPVAVQLLQAIGNALLSFSTFLTTPAGQKALQGFIDYLVEVGPKVADFVAALVDAFLNLAKALAPYGEAMLGAFTGFLEFLSKIDPKVLGAVVFAILGLVIAIQALLGLTAFIITLATVGEILGAIAIGLGLVTAAGAPMIAVLLGIILVLAAVVIALVILYTRSETFRDIVNGVFSFIGSIISFFWEHVVKPVFGFIMDYLHLLWTVWSTIFDLIWHILEFVGGKIADFATWVIDKLSPVTDWLKDTFGPAFSVLGEVIQGFWDNIQEIFKTGVRFVVDTVLNDGIIDTFNKIAGFFGSKTFERIKLPTSFYSKPADSKLVNNPTQHTTGLQYAVGGHVAGWSPHDRADNIPAWLTAGEFVLPVGSTRALRAQFGDGGLEMLRQGRLPLPGFANGGNVSWGSPGTNIVQANAGGFHFQVNALAKSAFEGFINALIGAGYDPRSIAGFANRNIAGTSKKSNHAWGAAIDIDPFGLGNGFDAGQTSKIGSGFKGNEFMANLAHQFGLGWGGEWKKRRDWMHFEVMGAPASASYGGGGNFLSNFFGGLKDAAGKAISEPLEWAKNQVLPLLDKIPGLNTPVGQMLRGMGSKLLDGALAKLKGITDVSPSDEEGVLDIASNGATQGVRDVVRSVAAQYGWGTGAEWDALQLLVASESSFNPNAKNPSSTAYGLFQFLDSTWAGYGQKTSDPYAQSVAGLRYIADRYTDPIHAWDFHKAHNYYSDGGEVGYQGGTTPVLYDSGGMLPPGLTTVLNASGRPEPVFTAGEFDRMLAGGMGGGGDTYVFQEGKGTPEEFASAIMFQKRVASRGGKYVGSNG